VNNASANTSEVLVNSRVAKRRMLDNIAHGSGVPLLLVRLSQIPDEYVASMSSDCAQGMRELVGAPLEDGVRPWWVRLFEEHEYDIFPAGRTFDAPFMTLLRDDPPFFWWELVTYARLAAEAREKKREFKVDFFELPGVFSDILIFGLTYLKEFDCHLVLGPVPMRDRIEPQSGEACPVERYCHCLEEVYALPGRDSFRHPALVARAPSAERLTRMFYLGGNFSRETFKDSAYHAATAIRHSCNVDMTQVPGSLGPTAHVIDAADALSKGTLFMERVRATAHKLSSNGTVEASSAFGALTPVTIDFRYPGRTGWKFFWDYDEAAKRLVSALTPLPRDNAFPERQAMFLRAGKHDPALNEMLDDLIERIGDRMTQDMLQQLTIGKNWIHDRFAQLSGMTESAFANAAELLENSNRICRWLLRLFDADFTAIYQLVPTADGQSTAVLKQFGRAARHDPNAKRWSEANQASMAGLEVDLVNRHKSICYRALWCLKARRTPNWDGKQSPQGLWIADAPDTEHHTRAGIAVPIKVFGRTWGVIELVGFTPNQFDRVDPIWLEEFGALIVDQFFHSSMLAEIYAINHEILWAGSKPREPREAATTDASDARDAKESRHTDLMDKICEHMARIFMADGAALWLEDENWPGIYELQGLFGIIEDAYRKQPSSRRPINWQRPRFERGDEKSLSIRAIDVTISQLEQARSDARAGSVAQPARRQVFQEKLDEHVEAVPSETQKARLEYHKRQWDSHVRHAAIIPLLVRTQSDEKETAIGTIALFTKDHYLVCPAPDDCTQVPPTDFSAAWVPLMDFAGSQAAMLVRALRLETHRQNQIELMFSHEVMSKATRISDQFSYVQRYSLNRLFDFRDDRLGRLGFNPGQVRNSAMAAERVSALSQMLTSSLQRMRDDGFLLHQNDIDFRAKKAERDKPARIVDVLRDAFNSRNSLMRERGLPPVMYIGNALNDQMRFASFARDDIATILENLADNAIKYCSQGRSVRISANLVGSALEIVISNMGDPFSLEEQMKLFKSGGRGAAARSSPQGGTGNGLYIARSLAQQIGADLSHKETPIPVEEGSRVFPGKILHNFKLLVTEREVVRDVR
jgi:signal transduction histidine kinase